jgi:hypothetical protein
LLLSWSAFNSKRYTVSRVGNPAFLLVLPGKPNNKWTKSKALNETCDIYF